MKREDIENAVELLDDDIIAEAGAVRSAGDPKKTVWVRFAAIAACAVLLVGAGIWAASGLGGNGGETPIDAELPMISLSGDPVGAMGFEGYLFNDISEFVSANPWNEKNAPDTLPVYKNPLVFDESTMRQYGGDFEEMEARARDIAGRLGIVESALEVSDDAPDEEERELIEEKFKEAGVSVPEGYFTPERVIAQAEGVKITVDQSLTATVNFDPAVALPKSYNFTHHASYDDKLATAKYLQEEYSALIGFSSPVINISKGDYNFYGERSFDIDFFEGGKNLSIAERILNFNFRSIHFACDDEGKLFIVRLYEHNLTEKLGDYPIVSTDEAKELLTGGYYITSVPYDMPGEEYIAKVELVYRTGDHESYFMPYYRFYVELPEELQDNGLKTYGAYYVPAVEGRYIENMEVWDGSFN